MSKKMHKLAIGLPVYNGEPFIKKRLENILSQTFSDFELIIDADPGTDNTIEICKEFEAKDDRIRLIIQEKRMGWMWSFNFVLKQAKSEYFVWAGVDDIWSPTFLEKNIEILDSHKDVVCSHSKIKRYGPWMIDKFDPRPEDSKFTLIYKRFRRRFRPFYNTSAYGTFENRVKQVLRKTAFYHIYGVYRTKILQKSMVGEFFTYDWAIVLNVLKHGNFYLIDEELMNLHTGGASDPSIKLYKQLRVQNAHINEYFFPYSSFTWWCAKNLGLKIFIKNLDYFLWLNFIAGIAASILGILDMIRNKEL